MLKLRFIRSGHLVYCLAIIALSALLPMPSAMGQVGEVVEEPPYEEGGAVIEETYEEPAEGYEEASEYSWINENQYYEEAVEKRNIDEANWKKAIEQNNLQGVNAISRGGWSSEVCKFFNITSIPRYMILNKSGKVVEQDAKRPSDETLKDDLLKLMAE